MATLRDQAARRGFFAQGAPLGFARSRSKRWPTRVFRPVAASAALLQAMQIGDEVVAVARGEVQVGHASMRSGEKRTQALRSLLRVVGESHEGRHAISALLRVAALDGMAVRTPRSRHELAAFAIGWWIGRP
jgi:hypothetical protein